MGEAAMQRPPAGTMAARSQRHEQGQEVIVGRVCLRALRHALILRQGRRIARGQPLG